MEGQQHDVGYGYLRTWLGSAHGWNGGRVRYLGTAEVACFIGLEGVAGDMGSCLGGSVLLRDGIKGVCKYSRGKYA